MNEGHQGLAVADALDEKQCRFLPEKGARVRVVVQAYRHIN